jgi:uncharacterized protein YggE
MKWLIGTCGVAALAAIGWLATSGRGEPLAKDPAAPARTLTAAGTGTVKVSADVARITFKVEASGFDVKTARNSLDRQTAKMKETLDGLKLGLEVRTLPVEVRQGNGANGIPPQFGVPGAPPALPAPPPVPGPAAPKADDKDAPEKAAPPDVPNAPPGGLLPGGPGAPFPGPMGGGFALPGFPGMPGAMGITIARPFVVTLTGADAAKLMDGANRVVLAAAENGAALGGNESPFGPLRLNLNEPASGPRVSFLKTDEREARRKALELAVADAAANAKALAKGADVKIVETIAINDPPASRTGQPIEMGTPTAENTTGEIEVTVRVTVTCSY